MLRILTGVALATVLVVSCGSDDDKRDVRDAEAGAGGEAGDAANPNAGGSSSNAAGQGGTAQTVAGAGGAPLADGGAAGAPLADAGAGAGGAPLAGAAGSAAAGDTGSAGAAGAPAEPVSQYCEPGEYYSGEGGCLVCEGAPEPQVVGCFDAFYAKDVLADGGPIAVRLSPTTVPREPLPVTVTVTYQLADSVEELETDMIFDFNSSQWEIGVGDVPLSATQIRVQPFTVQALCGDSFTLTDEVIFVSGGSDNWDAICPE